MERRLTAGVDLGGTKTAVALVGADGVVRRRGRFETDPERGPEAVLRQVAETLDDLVREAGAEATAIGVGVAGQVDARSGSLRHAPNLRWDYVPLPELLVDRAGRPVHVLNDVQAACYGEWRHGAGRDEEHVVCLFLGTGVGGGIVSGGTLLRGFGGSAGELGHLIVARGGPECTCGNRGCLEAHAGGWAIAREARRRVEAERERGYAILERAGGDPASITARSVAAAAGAGDPLARDVVAEAAAALAAGVISIANAFNPRLLVLGGSVGRETPGLREGLRAGLEGRALQAALGPLRIVEPELGDAAGAIGAAAWARDRA